LGNFLKELAFPPENVELVGLCTDICVLSNAVIAKAALPNAHITVDAAYCAGVTPESHDTALSAMKAIQVEVVNQGSEPWRKQ
jgi:nicotinamidase-related amidase